MICSSQMHCRNGCPASWNGKISPFRVSIRRKGHDGKHHGLAEEYGEPLIPYICDVGSFPDACVEKTGNASCLRHSWVLLRDIDFGIYPYTSSSYTIASYAPIGAGIPGHKLDSTVGIMKAYSTCVGEGPFTVEMFGEEADALRQAGGEYGAATGRPRRVGGLRCRRFKIRCPGPGATELAITKLDVLSYMKEIPVCVSYDIDGNTVTEFPLWP